MEEEKVVQGLENSELVGEDLQAETYAATETQKSLNISHLGMIRGVLIPCIQNIIGVLMFLRLPWITGVGGIGWAWAIVIVSCVSSFVTCLSLAAITTNRGATGGGAYQIISRTLGASIGGAVGLAFTFATTIAGSMYFLGAAEMIQWLFPGTLSNGKFANGWERVILALSLQMGALITILGGAKSHSLIGIGALLGLILATLSIITGTLALPIPSDIGLSNSGMSLDRFKTGLQPSSLLGKEETISSLTAIFYPSVTGIMAGSSRSVLLREPHKTIPQGTILAVIISTTIYLLMIGILGGALPRSALLGDKFIVGRIGWPHPLIVQCGAILSAFGAGSTLPIKIPCTRVYLLEYERNDPFFYYTTQGCKLQ